MKRYAKYKDSGISWIGEVPEHWEIMRAKYMFVKEKREIRDCDEVITCFRDGEVTLRKNRRTTGFTESLTEVGYQGIRKNDLVIHQMDAFAGAIGVSDSDGKGTSVYHCCTPMGDYNVFYYSNLLRTMAKKGFIQSLYRGIRERSSDFNFQIFSKQYLVIPPLSEQKAIADFLDKKTAQINELVAAKKKQIELLKEYKQAVIAKAVTQGINPKAKMKDSGITWIGQIPEHWNIKRIASLFVENKQINKDFAYKKAFQFKYGNLVPKNEIGNDEEYRETYVKYTVLNQNDIVFNGLNLNYDFVSQRVAISPESGIITSAYIAITPRNKVNAFFYSLLFKTMDNKKMLHGMGSGIRLTLSFCDLKSQLIPIPPLPEQEQIVAYIKEKVDSIDSQITSVEKQIANLNEFKQSLISDAVTGKIKVA
ncbi:MAG: restriction endonuclease subunit S [Fibrobacter sp.]|nr:restriction endonuclease subunit S [Fibrobacter sp.]